MIYVIAKHKLHPDDVEHYLDLAHELAHRTRTKDPGCRAYQILRDTADPNTVTILEQWESRDLLDAHLAAPYIREILTKMSAETRKEDQLNIYSLVE